MRFTLRTKLLGVMDGMDQNDSLPVARRRSWSSHMQCWFYWYCTSHCVPSCFRQASDVRHHGWYEPEGQLCVEMVINILVVPQRQFPLVLKTVVLSQPQFVDTVTDDLLCVSCRSPRLFACPLCATTDACGFDCTSLPCRGAEGEPHGPCDHRVSPVAHRYGGRCPNLQVVQISFVAQRHNPVGPLRFPSCLSR